ncbi:hypothetical protein [Chryseolinea sp. H1M3-3]|uniref:hypothetical protein n=1 Tax=Chryseolinea sp. H1M3-3 TaxID=3034144 RepID=UPI0023EA8839|nr:hypothetical protein [Chryseolinea sp. H1M3-3]
MTYATPYTKVIHLNTTILTSGNQTWPGRQVMLIFAAMRSILILIFITRMTLSNAQVVNSLSKDKTGLYRHTLDSVISIIKEK